MFLDEGPFPSGASQFLVPRGACASLPLKEGDALKETTEMSSYSRASAFLKMSCPPALLLPLRLNTFPIFVLYLMTVHFCFLKIWGHRDKNSPISCGLCEARQPPSYSGIFYDYIGHRIKYQLPSLHSRLAFWPLYPLPTAHNLSWPHRMPPALTGFHPSLLSILCSFIFWNSHTHTLHPPCQFISSSSLKVQLQWLRSQHKTD